MESSGGGGSMIAMLIWLAICVFFIVCMWKVFVKAGEPGWGCLVPFYNVYLFVKIAGRPWWWFILLLVPLINIIISIIIPFDIAKRFDKGIGFGFGLLFLGFIFYPILAFDDSTYSPA